MKYFRQLLVLILLGASLSMSARTIHWLTFIDTTDENVGQIDVYGREILYNRIIGVVNAALKEKGYQTAIHDIYGSRFSPEACKNELAALKVAPEDIVVFYYIGHGGRSKNDTVTWPQMQFGTNYDNKFVPLEWVHRTIKGKNPRLAVVIGMCCNSYVDGLSAKTTLQFSPNFGNTYMNDAQIENLAKLFTDYKGDIILSSSTPGQTSGCILFNNKAIDAFTGCLVDATDGVMNGRIQPDWNQYLGAVKTLVSDRMNYYNDREQTVQFKPTLTHDPMSKPAAPAKETPKEASRPAPAQNPANEKPVSNPTPKQEQSDDSSAERDELINYFNGMFNILADSGYKDDERIDAAEAFLANNSELAKVNVITLGQDSDTQVGRQSLEDFVGRIATSHLLQGINVAGIDGGRIYVREIYRR